MSTISSSTTSTTAYKVTADTTGTLVIQTGATPTTAVTVGTDQSVALAGNLTVTGTTTTTGYINVPNTFGFKNRIINGAMVIDQRNAGASVTPTNGQYTLDRWRALQAVASKYSVQQNAGSVTPPAGFRNYLGVTSLSSYSVGASEYFLIEQLIEGFNFADLNWGTADAQAVTLSFWVRSSLTGTFGGAFRNNAANRSYPFTYTISSANTWEQKSITVAGDTTGTWVGATNGVGVEVKFGLGVGSTFSGTAGAWAGSNFVSATGATSVVGTNGATFYITGVQLEKGSTATSFDYRPYGTELQLCQRYFQKSYDQANALASLTTTGEVRWQAASTGGESAPTIMLPVVMRTAPTLTLYSAATGASGNVRNYSTAADVVMTGANVNGSRGWSGGNTGFTAGNIVGYQFAASSEL